MFNGLTLLCLVFIAVVFAYMCWPRPQRDVPTENRGTR